MARAAGDYCQGTYSPIVKKFMIGASIARQGILAMAPAAGNAGIIPCTTTAVTNTVGLACDSGTYTTTQASTGTAAFVSCIVNPHLVIEYRMSGGATAGTSLSNQDETTGSAGGTAVTTGAEWSSPTYDEGVVWAEPGWRQCQPGPVPQVTSVSSTAGTVTVPFDRAIAVGDDFLRAPYWILDPTAKTIQFTSDLAEANAAIAVGTGGAMAVVGFRLNGVADSYVLACSNDHALNIATL
ncbi:MAG: hypothetical protein IPL14_19685 [Nitrospira sp.]|nr:hypothetical protein [Nitrospira sp.]